MLIIQYKKYMHNILNILMLEEYAIKKYKVLSKN